MTIAAGYNYSNITGNGTTVIKNSSGLLHSIIIGNNSTGGTITLYDDVAASGTIIMKLTIGSPAGGLLSTSGIPGPENLTPIDIEFQNGLTVVTTGASTNNITILYE